MSDWTAAESPHFELLAHASPRRARELVDHLERAASLIETRGLGTLANRRAEIPAAASLLYSSLHAPLANSTSAAITPNAFHAGSETTFRNNGQALRGLPSSK